MTTPVKTPTSRRLAEPDASGAPPATLVPPASPKLRRRPLQAILGVGLVAFGSLMGVWGWTSASTTTGVVATRTSIERGEQIEAQDLVVLQVNADPALRVIPGAQLDSLVGRRAATDIVAGSLVSPDQVADQLVPANGLSLVGVPLAAGQMPADELRGGDQVRIVQTPGAQGDVEGMPVTMSAEVLGVETVDGKTVVNLLVPSARAPELAARANTGKVALVVDARER